MKVKTDSCSANGCMCEEKNRLWYELIENDWEEKQEMLDTGIRMCYLTCGPKEGNPVILLHGATDSRITWSAVAPKLAGAGCRCYIPELRGHGKTDKPQADVKGYTIDTYCRDILNLMDRIGLRQAAVAGHSLGSLIAQELMIEAPERVGKAVLISSSARITDNDTLNWILKGDGEDYLGVKGYDDNGTMPDDFIREWTESTNEDPVFKKAVYEHAKTLPYEGWYNIFKGCDGLDNTGRLSEVTCPVDIIWGTEDVFFAKEDEKLLLHSLKNAEVSFFEVPEATHNIHWDSIRTGNIVAEEMIRFLRDREVVK